MKAAPALTAIGNYPLVLPLAGTLIRQVADGFLGRHGISAQAGLILRTEPGTSAAVQTFVSAVHAQAAAGRMPQKRRVR